MEVILDILSLDCSTLCLGDSLIQIEILSQKAVKLKSCKAKFRVN